jgi:hypothetical protein
LAEFGFGVPALHIVAWTTSGGNRVPRISFSQYGFPISRLTYCRTDSGSYTEALTASLPTMT